jgi:hypothetical protein
MGSLQAGGSGFGLGLERGCASSFVFYAVLWCVTFELTDSLDCLCCVF